MNYSFEKGQVVYDQENNDYGLVLNNYEGKGYGEIRLDTNGNRPEEYLHPIGSEGDKGSKSDLKQTLNYYKNRLENPSNGHWLTIKKLEDYGWTDKDFNRFNQIISSGTNKYNAMFETIKITESTINTIVNRLLKEEFTDHSDYTELLVNSAHGVYIPQIFVEQFRESILNANELREYLDTVINIDPNEGNRDDYHEAWLNIVDSAILIFDGKRYTISENEDLWAVRGNAPEAFWDEWYI